MTKAMQSIKELGFKFNNQFTSRNRHDVNASNANDITYCLIKVDRGTVSVCLNGRITINGFIIFKFEKNSSEKFQQRNRIQTHTKTRVN